MRVNTSEGPIRGVLLEIVDLGSSSPDLADTLLCVTGPRIGDTDV